MPLSFILDDLCFNPCRESREKNSIAANISSAGRTVNNLRFADDTKLLTEDKEDMRKLLKKIKEESEKAGLMLNLKKTKIMTTGTPKEFILEGTKMEITNCFTFLSSVITKDGYDYKKINRRLSIGRMVMTRLEKIMKDQDVKKATKIKIAETVIFRAVTYGIECWTVRKNERKKIDDFELRTWRKILRVPWTETIRIFEFWRKGNPKYH
jgi:hypothetical protein